MIRLEKTCSFALNKRSERNYAWLAGWLAVSIVLLFGPLSRPLFIYLYIFLISKKRLVFNAFSRKDRMRYVNPKFSSATIRSAVRGHPFQARRIEGTVIAIMGSELPFCGVVCQQNSELYLRIFLFDG